MQREFKGQNLGRERVGKLHCQVGDMRLGVAQRIDHDRRLIAEGVGAQGCRRTRARIRASRAVVLWDSSIAGKLGAAFRLRRGVCTEVWACARKLQMNENHFCIMDNFVCEFEAWDQA